MASSISPAGSFSDCRGRESCVLIMPQPACVLMDLLQALNIQVLLVDDCLLRSRSLLSSILMWAEVLRRTASNTKKNYHASQKQCDAVGNVLAPDRIHDGRKKRKAGYSTMVLGPGVNLALQIGCDPAEIVFWESPLAHHPDSKKAEQDVQKV